MTVHEVKRTGNNLQLLDVRAPDKWKDGHIPPARHVFRGELREHLGKPVKTKPTAAIVRASG
jgi:hydroxyacylglutathione hydrolase